MQSCLAVRWLVREDEAVRYALGSMVLVLPAVALSIASSVGVAADGGRTKLVGAWNRNVRDGSVLGASHTGLWSIRFGADGTDTVYEPVGAHVPGVRDTFTTEYQATASGRLVFGFGPGCPTEGIYRWSRTGDALRISKVADVCERRIAVMRGVWSRTQRIRGVVAPHQ
jgi:hypothetical protein